MAHTIVPLSDEFPLALLEIFSMAHVSMAAPGQYVPERQKDIMAKVCWNLSFKGTSSSRRKEALWYISVSHTSIFRIDTGCPAVGLSLSCYSCSGPDI